LGDDKFIEGLAGAAADGDTVDAGDEWGDSFAWTPTLLDTALAAEELDGAEVNLNLVNPTTPAELRAKLVHDASTSWFPGFAKNAAEDEHGFISLDAGLAVIAEHAKSLKYDGLILFMDELILWLANRIHDQKFVSREADKGYLDQDGELLFIGPEAEKRFGYRHFMDLTAVFTAAPEFTVLSGRTEIGTADPVLLTDEVVGPRRLLLAGRSWQVTYIDWSRRRCFVEPVESGGRARWGGVGLTRTASHELTRAARDILLGATPPVRLTRRAESALARVRDESAELVYRDGTVIMRGGQDTNVRWWTWAGYRTNATLAATLSSVADPLQRPTDTYVRLREDITPQEWRTATAHAADHLCLPAVDPRALAGLKFSVALPPRLAEATLAARLADLDGATALLGETVRFTAR
jgi:hypothetical protein